MQLIYDKITSSQMEENTLSKIQSLSSKHIFFLGKILDLTKERDIINLMSDSKYAKLYSSESKTDTFIDLSIKVANKIKIMKKRQLFVRQNNLPEDKIMYWLATLTSPFSSNEVKLEVSVKEDITSKIIHKVYNFGYIPPNLILPYLKFSDRLTWEISKIKIPTRVSSPAYNNILYLYKLMEKAYLDKKDLQKIIRNFFKNKIQHATRVKGEYSKELYVSITDLDDFPVISMNNNFITMNLNSYGILNPYAFESIITIYSLSKRNYINLYNKITNYMSTFVVTVYEHGLANKIKYNEGHAKLNNHFDILNIPELLKDIFPDVDSPFEQIKLLNTKLEHNIVTYSVGAQDRIIQYCTTQTNISSCLLKLLVKTNINLEVLTELNLLPQEIEDLAHPRILPDELKAIFVDMGVDEELPMASNLRHLFETNIPSRIFFVKYLAAMNIDHNLLPEKYNYDEYIIIVDILTIMHDYGLPGNEEKDKYPYGSRTLNYITSIFKEYQPKASFFDSICKLLNIKENFLNEVAFMIILKRGYVYPLPIEQRLLNRVKQWKIFTDEQKDLIKKLYSNTHLTLSSYINKDDTLVYCEQIISRYTPQNVNALIVELGMVVPYTKSPFEHFSKSLANYANISTRGENWDVEANLNIVSLPLMCDIEIIDFILGGYTGFNDRAELEIHATKFLLGEEVIVLVKDSNEVDITNEEKVNANTDRDELFKYISRAPSGSPFNLLFSYYDKGVKSQVPLVQFTISELNMCNHDLICASEEIDENLPIANTLRVSQLSVYTGKSLTINRIEQPEIKTLSSGGAAILTSTLNYCRAHFNSLVKYYIDKGTLLGINLAFETKENIRDDCNAKVVAETNELLTTITDKIINNNLRNKDNYKLEKERAELFLSFKESAKEIQLNTRTITVDVRQLIIQGLIIVFDCGMIQRQWNGIRGEYPYDRSQAGTEQGFEKNKDILVGDQLLLLNSVFNALKKDFPKANELFGSLTVKNLVTGALTEEFVTESVKVRLPITGTFVEEKKDKTLIMLYNDVAKGENAGGLCIRLASSKFIWTAYYWLKLFGSVNVLGRFDVLKMKHFG